MATKILFDLDPSIGELKPPTAGRIADGSWGSGGRWVQQNAGKVFPMTALSAQREGGRDITSNNRRIRFRVDKNQGGRRAELAPGYIFDFGTELVIDYSFKVRSDNIKEANGYLLQFWQPVISPIAGVRIQHGRLQVVSRTLGGVFDEEVSLNQWYDMTLRIKAGDDGFLELAGSRRVVGSLNGGSQASQATEDVIRPKFGFYGDPGPSELAVLVRKFTLAEVVA